MTKLTLIFLISSFAMFLQMNLCGKLETPKNTNNSIIEENVNKPKKDENADRKNLNEFQKISELNKQKPNKGTFETRGFVVKITDCPACPPNAQCKPCMRENLLISEENKSLDKYDLTDKELIVFTKDTENFEIGKEYKFKIKITTRKTTSQELNDLELIESEAIN